MAGAPLRLVDTGLAPARWNVAVTAALAEARRWPAARDVLRFHRYRPAVLVGCGQRLADAVDAAACRRAGVEIARRVSGGGAIVVTPSVLTFDLIVAGGARDLAIRVASAVAGALGELGAAPVTSTANAVLIGGAKVCGLAGSFDGRISALQASLLIADIGPAITMLLAPQIAAAKGPAMTDLTAALGRRPGLDTVQAAIGKAVAAVLTFAPQPDRLAAAELDLAGRLLAEEIGTDAFVDGDRPEPHRVGAL